MSVILISADLTVVSRVEGAAKKCDLTTRVVSSEAAAMQCDAKDAQFVIVDLGSPLGNLKAIVGHFKGLTAPPRIIAFGPHVQEGRLAAAREAGCDEVISRGQFFAQIDALMRS
jgi:hypothetical protein